MTGKFRSSANGFNKSDVINYIRGYAEEKQAQISALEAEIEDLNREISALEKKNSNLGSVIIAMNKDNLELKEKLKAKGSILVKPAEVQDTTAEEQE